MRPSDKNEKQKCKNLWSGHPASGAPHFPREKINFHPQQGLFVPVMVMHYLGVAAAPPGSVQAAGSPGRAGAGGDWRLSRVLKPSWPFPLQRQPLPGVFLK